MSDRANATNPTTAMPPQADAVSVFAAARALAMPSTESEQPKPAYD